MLPELEQWTSFLYGAPLIPLVVLLVISLIRLDRRSSAARVADALRVLEETRADYDEDRRRWRSDVTALRADLESERERCDRLEARVNALIGFMHDQGHRWPG